MKNGIQIKGFFRVHIKEDIDGKETLVGDSGWKPNVLTNLGIEYYLAKLLASSAGSLQVGFLALGTGGSPASNAVTLPGEITSSTKRVAVTKAYSARSTSDGSGTLQFTATFASSYSFLAGASNLSNIGLYNATTTNAQLFAGNTYASSAAQTNQAIETSYVIQTG